MNRNELIKQIRSKQSFLSVGLDSDIEKLPKHLIAKHGEHAVEEFNKAIIEATNDLCVSYKPNLAFYESRGTQGWRDLEATLDFIPDSIFTIADAKRGDIGNTSKQYAKAFFDTLGFDALTVAPYMGSDSVTPFLEYDNKWVILLALTSNVGSADFQMTRDEGLFLFERVLKLSQEWGNPKNLMYVIGATKPEYFKEIRSMAPDHFFLVPGIGAQGGELEKVCEFGMNDDVGLLVNSSRGIIFSSNDETFAHSARHSAQALQRKMAALM